MKKPGFGFLRLPQKDKEELDWDDPAMEAHKRYDIAARYGKEIVPMEPVR